ncbi:carbon storage regulator CsrA [Aquipseudomonas alcaligenes]|uniref:Translational regulator CsrA n=1 Tax=Aquipseudomonas alcaligenes TaxID=43263 RepID=A0A1N6XCS7_AQUAC|nr:carbon storage regulator CsrA [Pseudomonas alcaligenes]SIR00049.1 carbon storage regulator, CsrA [Pseudomonas alcaligenes]
MSLVFTRTIGQTFYIGDDVTVTVAAINGGQVKLAIDAPKHVEIYRKEIYLKIAEEKKAQGATL